MNGQRIPVRKGRADVKHERRTEGRRYVNDRWESPGWTHRTEQFSGSKFHAATKKEAVRDLVRWAADR